MSDPEMKLGDLNLTTNSFVFTMSREQAIDLGYEKPTPEEVEQYNAESRERWEKSKAQWALLDEAAAQLDAVDDRLARRILNLHARADDVAECTACSEYDLEDAYPVEWPCLTVVNVAEHFGIDLPDGYFGNRPGPEPYRMPAEGFQPFVAPMRQWHESALGRALDEATLHGETDQ